MSSKKLEGIASIALLPSGSISGHFVHTETMRCLGIYGAEIPCERECSRGEDYRLIKLTILEYRRKKEMHTIVQCKGHDFARFHNVEDVHGWEEGLIKENKHTSGLEVAFQCEILKSGKEADDHIARFLPSLSNRDAVVNVGTMTIKGLDFESLTSESDGGSNDNSNNNNNHDQQKKQQRSAGPAKLKSEKDYDPDFDPDCPVVHVESLAQLQVGETTDSSVVVEGLLKEELEAEGLSESPVKFEFDSPCAGWRLKNQSARKLDSDVTRFDEEQGLEASTLAQGFEQVSKATGV